MKLDHENIVAKLIKTFPLGGTYIDCGAHVGNHTKNMLSRSDVENVWAFEPIPDLFKNHLEKIQDKRLSLFNCAVGKKSGDTEFNINNKLPAYSGIKRRSSDNLIIKQYLSGDWLTINIPIKTLDSVYLNSNQKQINLIKIDVEGGEFDALLGSEKILRDCRPIVIFENALGKTAKTYSYNNHDFFNFFNSTNYSVKDFYGKTIDVDYWINFEKTLHTYMFVAIPNDKNFIIDYYERFVNEI